MPITRRGVLVIQWTTQELPFRADRAGRAGSNRRLSSSSATSMRTGLR
jgi:hypothetical protein